MAHTEKHTQTVENVRPYVEGVAKYLVDKLYGADGPLWGTRLTDLEGTVVALRTVLSEKFLAEALTRQAAACDQRPARYQACPGCQQPLPCEDVEPRIIQTDVGEAQWTEPKAYCRKCRQAFFPSVPQPGH